MSAANAAYNQQQTLYQLYRRYRLEENKKKQLVYTSYQEMRRQASILSRLQYENALLREKIADQTHLAAGATAVDGQRAAESLLSQKYQLEASIQREREQIVVINNNIKYAEQQVQQLRQARAEAERARPSAQAVERKIALLENQLQLTSTKYNAVLAQNSQLRGDIQHLRSEHLHFEKTHFQYIQEQEEKQAKMAELMDLARAYFQLREQLQTEIQQLEEYAKREEAKFRDDWAELNKIIEKDAKRRAIQQQYQEQNKHQISQISQKRETELETTQAQPDSYSEADYERAFREIIKCGCYNDIAELEGVSEATPLTESIIIQIINRFLENEEKNFSLFNYANDLRAEVEAKEEELFGLREQLRQARKRKAEADAGLKQEVAALEMQLQQVKSAGAVFEQKCERLAQSMGGVYSLVEQVFNVAQCPPISGVSGAGAQTRKSGDNVAEGAESTENAPSAFVNSENVLLHLSAIEGVVDGMIGKLLGLIRDKKLSYDAIDKYIINRQDEEFVQNLAPASAAIIQLLNKEDDILAEVTD